MRLIDDHAVLTVLECEVSYYILAGSVLISSRILGHTGTKVTVYLWTNRSGFNT